MSDMQNKSIHDVISFVERRKMDRIALSAISSLKRNQLPTVIENKTETNKQVPCPECGAKFQVYKQRVNGTFNTKPHTKCLNCLRASRRKPGEEKENAPLASQSTDTVFQVSVLSVDHKNISLNHVVISKCDLRKTRKS